MYSTSTPFKTLGCIAIIAGGFIAAAVAHAPTQAMVWLIAYLILVVGVAQYVLGAAQATITAAADAPRPSATWLHWLILNLGHAAVITAALANRFNLLIVGTILYEIAMLWFAWSVRHTQRSCYRAGYWLLIAIMFGSAIVGLLLSTFGP